MVAPHLSLKFRALRKLPKIYPKIYPFCLLERVCDTCRVFISVLYSFPVAQYIVFNIIRHTICSW